MLFLSLKIYGKSTIAFFMLFYKTFICLYSSFVRSVEIVFAKQSKPQNL